MRPLLALAALILLAGPAAAQVGGPLGGRANVPQVPKGMMTEHEADFRLFKKLGVWEPMAEAAIRWQGEQRQSYKSLSLGGYNRVHRNLKVGAFYKLQFGARYDFDWVETADRREWIWKDTQSRDEHVFILDASPRVQVPWVDDVVASVKTQFHANATNGTKWFRLAPDLTYHHVRGLKPVASLTLQWDAMMALTTGEILYDQWVYLGALYHATPKVSVGPRLGYRRWVWNETEHFARESQGRGYRTVYKALVFGLDVVSRL